MTSSQSIRNTDLYIHAYRSFLRGQGTMTIDQITRLYQNMKPSIHKGADAQTIDTEAFMYASLRLPRILSRVHHVVLAQIGDAFSREGYKLEFWEEVHAPARRRKMYFDGEHTLAVFINSVTDLDDIVGLLTAYSIEWNKIHKKLSAHAHRVGEMSVDEIQLLLGLSEESWHRIVRAQGDALPHLLADIADRELHLTIRLLRGSYVDYKKAAQRWFEHIVEHTRYRDLRDRPLYFVSSNTHSLVNNLTGWVRDLEPTLIAFLKEQKMEQFLTYWREIEAGEHPGSKENFLWYILKKYEALHPEIKSKRYAYEESLGIDFIDARHYLDINAQVMAVKDFPRAHLAEKLGLNKAALADSDALVLNIDYPLGFGAYMVLSTVLRNANNVRGVYILGKASFLHGNLGDIAIPTTVFDTYSGNTFTIQNAFSTDSFPDFTAGSVLVDQKVVSTKGTFLHPEPVIQQYFMDGYAIVEMEDGPYLDALFETVHFGRYPEGETVSLISSPIDIGIIHYASDTPFTKAITLGTRNLGYEGVEATYASSLAILRRIVEREMGE